MKQWDAIILAGDRGVHDPVAMAANVEGKAYATLGANTLLERVATELRQCARIKNIFAVGPGIESLDRHQGIQAALEKLQVQPISPAAGPSASALKGLTTSSFYPSLLVTCDLALINTRCIETYCDAVINLQADFVATAIDYQKIHEIIPSLRKTRYRFNQSSWCFANVFAVLNPNGLKAIEYWQHLEESRKKPIQLIRKIDWWSLVNYKLGRLSLEQVALTLSQKVGAHLQIVNMSIPELAIDVDSAHDYRVVKSYLDSH